MTHPLLRTVRVAALATLVLTTTSATLTAQRRSGDARPVPGWIGVSFEVATDRWGRSAEVIITEVSEGSPAARAGLKAGDRLLSINDLNTVRELSELSERLRIEAGDRVALEVQRGERKYRIGIRAEERPVEYEVGRYGELSFQSDSMVETWVRAMDSLRVQLVEGREQSIRITAAPRNGRAGVRVVTTEAPDPARGVQPPFEFFIFRGEAHDSLRQEMVELNEVMQELQHRFGERELEVRTRIGAQDAVARDVELRRLSDALEAANRRSVSLEAAMASAARATAGYEYASRAPRPVSGSGSSVSSRTEEFRPLTPYLLGRNRVAGAEVVDLRPELAEYFKVAGGVLVVDVAPGTPAAIAGILPGDVITRLDQVGVRTVEDLRFGVSRAGETLPIALIRQGASVQVLLRR